MMCFPEMLITACEKENIPHPTEEEVNLYTERTEEQIKQIAEKYPKFHVFCCLQLGRAIRWGEHWDNAKVIANFPEDKIKTAMIDDFIEAGFEGLRTE